MLLMDRSMSRSGTLNRTKPVRGVILDLGPQAPDVDINGPCFYEGFVFPDRIGQLVAAEHSAFAFGQEREQFELRCAEMQGTRVFGDAIGLFIDSQVAEAYHPVAGQTFTGPPPLPWPSA